MENRHQAFAFFISVIYAPILIFVEPCKVYIHVYIHVSTYIHYYLCTFIYIVSMYVFSSILAIKVVSTEASKQNNRNVLRCEMVCWGL